MDVDHFLGEAGREDARRPGPGNGEHLTGSFPASRGEDDVVRRNQELPFGANKRYFFMTGDLVDKAAGFHLHPSLLKELVVTGSVLRSRQLLLEIPQPESHMNALVENASEPRVPFKEQDPLRQALEAPTATAIPAGPPPTMMTS